MGVGGEHKACSYSEFGVRALRHQGATAFLMFKIDISRNTSYAIVSGFCRSGHMQFCMLRLLLTLTYGCPYVYSPYADPVLLTRLFIYPQLKYGYI